MDDGYLGYVLYWPGITLRVKDRQHLLMAVLVGFFLNYRFL